MQLYIRQRLFSWTDSYDVFDTDGIPRYEVKAEFLSLTHKIHVYDKRTGTEVGAIRQRLLSLLPTFEILIGDQIVGVIRQKFTLLRQRYEVDYRGWDVDGNFLGWEYRVIQDRREILTISKDIFRLTDCYCLNFRDPSCEILGLLLVLAIDAANCSHNN